jgi:hypothetical protein
MLFADNMASKLKLPRKLKKAIKHEIITKRHAPLFLRGKIRLTKFEHMWWRKYTVYRGKYRSYAIGYSYRDKHEYRTEDPRVSRPVESQQLGNEEARWLLAAGFPYNGGFERVKLDDNDAH